MTVADVVTELGGFATTRELKAAGASERMLTAAVRFGHVRRVRNGWYSTVDPSDLRFRAVRVGGRLTGVSAFRAWGAWILRRADPVHVAVAYNAARLRETPTARVHFGPRGRGGTHTEVSVHDALVRLMLDEPAEVVVPCVDWLLRSGRADLIDIHRAGLEVPEERRRVLDLVDRRSQSILESVARVRLRERGFRVHPQQRTGELGASDLLVEGEVTLELDGREHHAERFEQDRRRDLVTTIEGKHVLRVSEPMVREIWTHIVRAIFESLRARHVGNSGTPIRAAPIPRQPHRVRGRGS